MTWLTRTLIQDAHLRNDRKRTAHVGITNGGAVEPARELRTGKTIYQPEKIGGLERTHRKQHIAAQLEAAEQAMYQQVGNVRFNERCEAIRAERHEEREYHKQLRKQLKSK